MILIAVPTFETICPETFKSIYELAAQDTLTFDFVKGYDCALARNKIAIKALEQNADYVLMVDSDIIVPRNTLQCMLEYPVDICLGVYPRKNTTTGQTEIFKLGNYNFVDENNLNISEITEPGRCDVKGGGLGCALIRTDVFRQLPSPWFKYVQYDTGDTLSEDNYFCWKAAEAGFRIQVDTRVRCGHLVRTFNYE